VVVVVNLWLKVAEMLEKTRDPDTPMAEVVDSTVSKKNGDF